MKLYAPKYYLDFKCIADRCRHSCCIGWEIDIDDRTVKKYHALTDGYGAEIRKTIDFDGSPHFRLGEGERCPHLDERGLCRIITSLGEEYLCHICREHPRFYHNTPSGKEVGLGMACEEACRLILQSDEYDTFVEIGEAEEAYEGDFDPLSNREKLYAILSDEAVLYTDRLRRISETYGISPDILSDEEWQEVLASLEYLEEAHQSLFFCYSSDLSTPPVWEKILERALAYFIFRYCTDSADEDEFRCSLGFCLVCERLLASILKSEQITKPAEAFEIARMISEEIDYSEENVEAIKLEFSFIS